MKPKFLLCLVVVILLNSLNQALSSMVVIMVDATNIQTMPFIVRTDTSGNAADRKSVV